MTADVIEVELINKLAEAIKELDTKHRSDANLVQAQVIRELSEALAAIRGAR